jgi:ATP-dependent Lhr-like helicase
MALLRDRPGECRAVGVRGVGRGERGGRTLLTRSEDPKLLEPAAEALADAVRRGALGRLTVEKADGAPLLGSGETPLRQALQYAGFIATPRGLRLTAPSR